MIDKNHSSKLNFSVQREFQTQISPYNNLYMSESIEIQTKRQKHRIQIRRKNIQQHCRKIRNQWITDALQTIEQTQMSKYTKNIVQNAIQYPNQQYNKYQHMQQNRQNSQQISGQMVLFNSIQQNNHNISNILSYISQLSYENRQIICQPATINKIKQIICILINDTSIKINDQIQIKVQIGYQLYCAMAKLCINSHFHGNETLYLVMDLLGLMIDLDRIWQTQTLHIGQLTTILSQCSEMSNKQIIYTHILTHNCLKYLVKDLQNTITVLGNFISCPPVVSHTQCPQKDGVRLVGNVIEVLMQVLKRVRDVKEQLEKMKVLGLVSDILWALVSRLQYSELIIVVEALYQCKFNIISQILILFNQVSRKLFSHNGSNQIPTLGHNYSQDYQNEAKNKICIKVKLKIFKIAEMILSSIHYINQKEGDSLETWQRMNREFLYLLLPSLLSTLVPDLYKFIQQIKPVKIMSELYRQYQLQLLVTMRQILSVRDQLNQILALQFINLKYNTLFADIYHQCVQIDHIILQSLKNKHSKKYLILLSLLQIYIRNTKESCQIGWVSTYMANIILNHEYSDGRGLEKIISTLQLTLDVAHDHNYETQATCRFLQILSSFDVVKKLQSLEQYYSTSHQIAHKRITSTIENLLSLLNEQKFQF